MLQCLFQVEISKLAFTYSSLVILSQKILKNNFKLYRFPN